jgi:iron complex outermembrane receptor protein
MQTDAAAFAEIFAPVTTMLELDAQARFDHFNVSGNATTPSIGFKFKPVRQFALRGTYGLGFRAPNPAEYGNAGQAYSAGTASDPILCPSGPTTAGAVISQCSFNLVYENSIMRNSNRKSPIPRRLASSSNRLSRGVPRWITTR